MDFPSKDKEPTPEPVFGPRTLNFETSRQYPETCRCVESIRVPWGPPVDGNEILQENYTELYIYSHSRTCTPIKDRPYSLLVRTSLPPRRLVFNDYLKHD